MKTFCSNLNRKSILINAYGNEDSLCYDNFFSIRNSLTNFVTFNDPIFWIHASVQRDV